MPAGSGPGTNRPLDLALLALLAPEPQQRHLDGEEVTVAPHQITHRQRGHVLAVEADHHPDEAPRRVLQSGQA